MAHVALLTSSLWGATIQRMFLNLAGELAATGDRVDLLACRVEKGLQPSSLPNDVRVMELDGRSSRQAWMQRHKRRFVTAPVGGLASYLRRERPEALLAGGKHANLIAVWARRMAAVDTRVVISEHTHLSASLAAQAGGKHLVFPSLARATYPHADHVVLSSRRRPGP